MLVQKIYEFVTKYHLIENGDKIVLGVSGGPDSICMLDVLDKIKNQGLIEFEIVVAHVNHGLRENAVLDEEFVKSFCAQKGIAFFVKTVNVKHLAEEQKRGIEEMGRIVRYDFFQEVLQKTGSQKIAIAHHCNDKIETIMMNILRGTGTKGLIGIEKVNGNYIRPLLETKKEEIEEYLNQNNIVARQDESNLDNGYTRNKIRNVVIPYIEKEFNPNIVETMNRLSQIAKEQEEYFQKEVAEIYQEICVQETEENRKEIILDLKKLNGLDKVLQKRVILYSIEKLFGSSQGIEKVHIEDIIKLCHNNIGNKYLTPNKHLKIVTQKKQLKIMAVSC